MQQILVFYYAPSSVLGPGPRAGNRRDVVLASVEVSPGRERQAARK